MDNEQQIFTISALTENKSGLLTAVTIIFTRRKINIESINVSETEVEGVSRYTIVIRTGLDTAVQVVKQINKLIEVLGAFLYTEEEVYYQEIALFKMSTEAFLNNNTIERLVRNNGARILVIEENHIVIEKTGHRSEIRELFKKLKPHGVLESVPAGTSPISKTKRKTDTFLKELENNKYIIQD